MNVVCDKSNVAWSILVVVCLCLISTCAEAKPDPGAEPEAVPEAAPEPEAAGEPVANAGANPEASPQDPNYDLYNYEDYGEYGEDYYGML